jgi:hypothetical protein
MAINQFAKISPLVNSEGYLLSVNQDGIIISDKPEATSRRLKNNEVGIVYSDNSLITIYDGNVIKLGNSSYTDKKNFEELVESNTDGRYDGTFGCIVRESVLNGNKYLSYDVCVIKGTKYFNVSDNLIRGDFWPITDTTSVDHTNTYIPNVPYTITRLTVRIAKDIMSNGEKITNGVFRLYTDTGIIHNVDIYGDIESTSPIFECVNVFRDFLGTIKYAVYDKSGNKLSSLSNISVKVFVEYLVK